MTEEERNVEVAVSEQPEVESQEAPPEEQKMVPLAALEAERRKRQEAENAARLYQEYLMREREGKAKQEEPEDEGALVEKKTLREESALTKREILEQVYQDMNPEGVQQINKHIKKILEHKPWLADSIASAQNRYARAFEIVKDYMHLVETPVQHKSQQNDAQRIIQNAQKPRSPVDIGGKSQQPEGAAYLKSIQGKKEFREYRQKVLRGEI